MENDRKSEAQSNNEPDFFQIAIDQLKLKPKEKELIDEYRHAITNAGAFALIRQRYNVSIQELVCDKKFRRFMIFSGLQEKH
jgi:hypothetical protein